MTSGRGYQPSLALVDLINTKNLKKFITRTCSQALSMNRILIDKWIAISTETNEIAFGVFTVNKTGHFVTMA